MVRDGDSLMELSIELVKVIKEPSVLNKSVPERRHPNSLRASLIFINNLSEVPREFKDVVVLLSIELKVCSDLCAVNGEELLRSFRNDCGF